MSHYFFKRIKNVPTSSTTNGTTTRSLLTSQPQAIPSMSDEDLLAGALQFEQTDEFKQAEEQAKKARGE